MATQLQIRRGTTAQMNAFTGAEGELAVNTSTDTVHVHDGATAGGFALAKADGSNIGTYAGSFTTISASGAITGNVTGNLTGSVLTAAQTNITSVGTLSTLAVTGALTVDTNTFVVDATNNRVGIGITPATLLDIKESTAATDAIIGLTAGTGGRAQIRSEAQADNTSSELSFYTMSGSNTSEAMRISGSNVGIGTSSPATQLFVKSTANAANVFAIESANAAQRLQIGVNTSNGGSYIFEQKAQALRFGTSDTQRMLIDGAGLVGIGTSSPAAKLDISGVFQFFDDTTPELRIVDSDDNNYALLGYTDGTMVLSSNHGNEAGGADVMQFLTGGAERMRISSGTLLVGKTSNTFSAPGFVANANGMGATRSGGACVQINRTSSDGTIQEFYKDGSIVGSIGASGGDLFIGTGAISWKFFDAGGAIIPADASGGAKDNAVNLGAASARMEIIFAGTGTINTSDRNEKQDIEALSDAERRVAVAAKGLMRKFRWKDAVAEKGNNARIHFGIIAQDLQAAFEAEGLDAARYGMWCSDTWTDIDTGEERTRLGVRYSELLAFIISAI